MIYDIHNLPEDFVPIEYDKRTLQDMSAHILSELENEPYFLIADSLGDSEEDVEAVLICNWNEVNIEWMKILEAAGYALRYEDEVIVCGQNKVWELYPAHLADQLKWMITEGGEIITIEDEPYLWIEESQITDHMQPIKSLPNWIGESYLHENRYRKYNDEPYQSGLHTGMDDDPTQIAKAIFEDSDEEIDSLVFRTTNKSQFYIEFDVWVRYV